MRVTVAADQVKKLTRGVTVLKNQTVTNPLFLPLSSQCLCVK